MKWAYVLGAAVAAPVLAYAAMWLFIILYPAPLSLYGEVAFEWVKLEAFGQERHGLTCEKPGEMRQVPEPFGCRLAAGRHGLQTGEPPTGDGLIIRVFNSEECDYEYVCRGSRLRSSLLHPRPDDAPLSVESEQAEFFWSDTREDHSEPYHWETYAFNAGRLTTSRAGEGSPRQEAINAGTLSDARAVRSRLADLLEWQRACLGLLRPELERCSHWR